VYYYIYDDFTQDKKYQKELAKIENRLTDLGISGKISRLALFRNADEMIYDEMKRGVSTVVAVGNDSTARKVLDAVTDHEGVTFGLIPLGSPNTLAKLLGIPYGVDACDVLSARITETIDVGTVNGKRFISGVSIPNFAAEVTCEDTFRLKPKKPGTLEVRNLAVGDVSGPDQVANPHDGLLETIVQVDVKKGWGIFKRNKTQESRLPVNSLSIHSEEPISVFCDGEELTGRNFDIDINPGALRVITGKGRMF
jgi:diacylglycerol kinase family enzyme